MYKDICMWIFSVASNRKLEMTHVYKMYIVILEIKVEQN